MQEGLYDEILLEAVMHAPVQAVTIYDAYCFAIIHAKICEHELRLVRIPIGRTCFPDHARAEMNAALRTVPFPYAADFKGDSDDADGIFEWKEPMILDAGNGNQFRLEPSILPLEVGFIDAATVLNHIMLRGGIARWPYAREEITLLIEVPGEHSSRLDSPRP